MNTKLNVKQWALATLAVFVIMTIFAFILSRLGIEWWAAPVTQSLQPDVMTGRIAVYLSRLIAAGLFTFIFTKAPSDKPGMGHGLRYGFGMGLLLFVPNFVTGLVYWEPSTGAQTLFMVVGVIQSVVCGATMAQLYKPSKA
jgi:hypothetical protein